MQTIVVIPFLDTVTGNFFPKGCFAFVENESTDGLNATCNVHGITASIPKNHLMIDNRQRTSFCDAL